MMKDQFIRDRITQLRIIRGYTEYGLSFRLGHSKSYINNITSGKSLPQMREFLALCEALEVTPCEFFDEQLQRPAQLALKREASTLDDRELQLLINMAEKLNSYKK